MVGDGRERKWWWCRTHDVVEYGWNYSDGDVEYECVFASEFAVNTPCDVVEAKPPVAAEGGDDGPV